MPSAAEHPRMTQTQLSLTDLERYLHDHIPISAAMQVRVRAASFDRVELTAPLGPNINHRETAFGGSIAAIATLSAWALLNLRLQQLVTTNGARLVIQRNTMSYDEPIGGDFSALCTFPDASLWQRFLMTYERRGRARITLSSAVFHAGRAAAAFEGEFVALRPSPA
jgi:thioesterase domain-containing protein